MCPGVLTVTCAIDSSIIFVSLIVIDWSINVDVTIECTATVVVTTIDTRAVAAHKGIATVPVDVGFIYITRIPLIQTVSTAEDGLCTEGRALWHIDHRATGDTLLIATTIDSLEVSAQQVDDG